MNTPGDRFSGEHCMIHTKSSFTTNRATRTARHLSASEILRHRVLLPNFDLTLCRPTSLRKHQQPAPWSTYMKDCLPTYHPNHPKQKVHQLHLRSISNHRRFNRFITRQRTQLASGDCWMSSCFTAWMFPSLGNGDLPGGLCFNGLLHHG